MSVLLAERRRDPRARVQVRLELHEPATGRLVTLQTTNLSCGGARCVGACDLPEGALVEGRLYLPLTEAGRDVDVALPVKARLLRGDAGEAAIEFAGMTDADRAELAAYLFAWLADDCAIHGWEEETA